MAFIRVRAGLGKALGLSRPGEAQRVKQDMMKDMMKGQTMKIRLKGDLNAGFFNGKKGDVYTVHPTQGAKLIEEKPHLVEEVKEAKPKGKAKAKDKTDEVPGAPPVEEGAPSGMKTKTQAARAAKRKP